MLFNHLNKNGEFSEKRCKFYIACMALGIGFLHKHKIAYRDLKPENVLMDAEGYVCLADFGQAKVIRDDESTTTYCGSLEYLAPEIIPNRD